MISDIFVERMSVFADMVEVHGIDRPWRFPCKKLQLASVRQAMEATRSKARSAPKTFPAIEFHFEGAV